MTQLVYCPNTKCGKSYQVAAEHLGRRGRCKSCGTEFVFAATNSGSDQPVSQTGPGETSAVAKTGSLTGSTQTGRAQFPAKFGRFQILERVGAGGFGAVYRAQDPQLQRTVALKLLQSTGDEHRDQHRINRFLVEGRAGARLQHPNIVPVFDAGKDEETGEYYMAAAYIAGGTLSTKIDGAPMDLRRAAAIVSQLARALDYAHGQGILHRDVKPDNVMLDEQSVPHLMDFGLARMEESESHLTRDGAVMGTPSYMSPEQCVGKQDVLGPSADQYSLGCLFYELLTGEKLFDGPVSVQIHHQINTEAPPPSRKNSAIPPDLDTICLKTLAKEPERRYASCAALAADLDRWLADEPIQARQLTAWERWNRWRRRNPAIAGLSVGLAAALLLGLVGISTQWIRAENLARAAILAAEEQKQAKETAEAAQQTAVAAEGRAVKDRESARAAAAANKRIAYSAHMNLGQQAWNEANIDFLHDLLERYLPEPDQEDLRCFEWYYWWRMSHGYSRKFEVQGGGISDVAVSSDEKFLATATFDSVIRLWDFETGELKATLSGHGGNIFSMCFSQDGKTLATGSSDGTARLWDVASGQQQKLHQANGGSITAVAFLPDEQTLAIASKKITIWNFVSDESRSTAEGLDNGINRSSGTYVAFSSDGKKLATGGSSNGSNVKVWDTLAGTHKELRTGHQASVTAVAFSPDAKTLVTGSWDHVLKVWDLDSATEKFTLRGHSNDLFDVAYAPDGKTIASTGRDLTVRLWDAATGRPIDTLKGHSGRISTVAYAPDSRRLVSAGRDYQAVVWDLQSQRPDADVIPHPQLVLAAAFSPDSRTVVTGSGSSHVDAGTTYLRFWDTATGVETRKWEHPGVAKVIAFHPTQPLIATGSAVQQTRVWDLASGELKQTFPAPCGVAGSQGLIRSLCFSPDGSLLATNGEKVGSINLWDPLTGELKQTLAGDGAASTGTAFSPDGTLVAAGGWDSAVRVWEVATGRRVHTLKGHTERVLTVAFALDGKALASAGGDTEIKLWDVETGTLRTNLTGHTDTVNWLAFAPDGKTLATTAGDATVKLWDATTGDLKTTLTGHNGYNYCVAFAPDGKTLASGSMDKSLRLWRAAKETDVNAGKR